MRRLIEGLARRFDRVVIDSTAAHFADAGVVEPMVDGVLLVVRAGRTGRPSIARALGLVPRTKLLGLILNDSRSAGR
jgi:Mrp family chromosome partitioning ATPase